MKSNNKELLQLKKLFNETKLKHDITEKFSYRFDYRTGKLILSYYVPTLVRKNGILKTINKKVEKYRNEINRTNFKKYFKGRTSIVIDDAQFVREEIEKSSNQNYVGDEHDFKWWIESYLSRTFGQTKTLKPLSESTIKSYRNHLNQYYDYLIENFKESETMSYHIDNGYKWFENYYTHQFEKKKWSPTTIGISFRTIRGFYNFVSDRLSGYDFPRDILRKLKIPKAQNKRDSINPHEFNLIMDFIVKYRKDPFWNKFILLLRLQLKTGMRVGELVNIRTRNVDIENKRIMIVGKGDKSRWQNFGQKHDKKLWKDIMKKYNSDALYLFYQTRVQEYPKSSKRIEIDVDLNSPTSESYYLKRFGEMRSMLDIRGKGIITSHSLRRYFITEFVKKTGNRDLVRQIVGHETTRMTDYYVGNMINPTDETTLDIGV
jgi:integrase